jgi:hypothetical protein
MVSAASGKAPVATGSIVSIYGADLAATGTVNVTVTVSGIANGAAFSAASNLVTVQIQ